MPECRSPFDKLLVYDVPTTSRTINIGCVVIRRHSGILPPYLTTNRAAYYARNLWE